MLKRWAAWPRGNRWLAGIPVVVFGLAVVWTLFMPLADWLARQDVGSATGALHETAVDNARGRLLTLGAGLVAVAALVFTALNFSLLRRNSEQADQWQRRTHELTEQGQVTDRYTKAIEQLGSDKLDVRIGGIYALERIARDSATDHPIVMEVLTAFIREHSHEQWPQPDPDGRERKRRTRPDVLAVPISKHSHEQWPQPDPVGREGKGWTRPDVQAAITVVGRRHQERDIPGMRIDLIGANLTGATLVEARLAGANLFGADLSGARLDRAILDGADLGGSDLTQARLFFARLAGADLHGALLAGAQLTNVCLDGTILASADLTGASLYGASLEGAILLNACLEWANLDGATLADAQLEGAQLDGALWPRDTKVPAGWKLDTGSGRLIAAGSGAEPAGAN